MAEIKKEILLLGDSIRMGYCETVREALKDTYTVAFPSENCRSTQHTLIELWRSLELVKAENTALVLFNCGHWDIARWSDDPVPLTSEGEYGRNIGLIIERLRRYFPGAKLVFATTSRMNPGAHVCANYRDDAIIGRYNDIASAVCREKGISVMEMNRYCEKYTPADYADYCHLTPEAFHDLGLYVAGELRKLLEA